MTSRAYKRERKGNRRDLPQWQAGPIEWREKDVGKVEERDRRDLPQ